MNERLRKFLPFIVLGLVVAMFLVFAQSEGSNDVGQDLSYSSFIDRVESGEVRSVTMQGGNITGTLSGGQKFNTFAPEGATPTQQLRDNGVRIQVKPVEDGRTIWSVLLSWFPMLLLIGVVIYFMPL